MKSAGTKGVSGESHGNQSPLLNLPNRLTIARLILSLVFFVILALESYGIFGAENRWIVLDVTMVLFILAVSTDFLDGYLARRWGLVSTFGRIADPLVDKIVICGGFVMLTGVAPSLVGPWFVVVILVREFLVSGLRSFLESQRIAFAAAFSGKVKMVLQSIAVPTVLFVEAHFSAGSKSPDGLKDIPYLSEALYGVTVALLAATLISAVVSCVGYVRRAVRLLKDVESTDSPP